MASGGIKPRVDWNPGRATERSFKAMVLEADPQWNIDSKIVPDFEFSSRTKPKRVFMANYTARWPFTYVPPE